MGGKLRLWEQAKLQVEVAKFKNENAKYWVW